MNMEQKGGDGTDGGGVSGRERCCTQVASRSLQNEASPSFLLSVATETQGGAVQEHLMHADYATVLRLKCQVEQALKEATSLDTRRLMRQVKLAK